MAPLTPYLATGSLMSSSLQTVQYFVPISYCCGFFRQRCTAKTGSQSVNMLQSLPLFSPLSPHISQNGLNTNTPLLRQREKKRAGFEDTICASNPIAMAPLHDPITETAVPTPTCSSGSRKIPEESHIKPVYGSHHISPQYTTDLYNSNHRPPFNSDPQRKEGKVKVLKGIAPSPSICHR